MSLNYLNKLSHYRRNPHLTQQAVASHLGHQSASRISAWEAGTAKPALPNLMKLASLYRIPVEKLYPSLKGRAPTPRPKRRATDASTVPHTDYKSMSDAELAEELAKIMVETFVATKELSRH